MGNVFGWVSALLSDSNEVKRWLFHSAIFDICSTLMFACTPWNAFDNLPIIVLVERWARYSLEMDAKIHYSDWLCSGTSWMCYVPSKYVRRQLQYTSAEVNLMSFGSANPNRIDNCLKRERFIQRRQFSIYLLSFCLHSIRSASSTAKFAHISVLNFFYSIFRYRWTFANRTWLTADDTDEASDVNDITWSVS